MSGDVDKYLSECKSIYDVTYEIDDSAVAGCDLTDSQKDFVKQYIPVGTYRALADGDYGFKHIFRDEGMSSWFKEKTSKVKVTFDPAVSKTVSIKWDDKTFTIVWGKSVSNSSMSSYHNIYYCVEKAFESVKHQKKFKEEIIPKAEDTISRTFGPGKGFEIGVDWESFDDAEDKENGTKNAIEFLFQYDGYYSTQKLTQAVYRLSAQEEDPIVDAVCDGLKKVTFALQPGNDPNAKTYTADKKGNVVLKLCFETRSSSGIFEADDLSSILLAAGLRSKPELKTYLLSSVCSAYRIYYWGELGEVEDLVGKEGMGLFHKTDEEECKVVEKHEHKGRIVKFFDCTSKVNRHGKKQKRNVLVTSERYTTCEMKSATIKEKNFREHSYEEIVCIDMWPQPSKIPVGPKPFAMTIWTTEKDEEKKGLFGKMPKLPGVKLPGIPLPKVDIPVPKLDINVDIPKIDVKMPKVDLPELPDISMPGMFKRHKEPKPKRSHPATKDVRSFSFIAEGIDTKPGNLLLEELAWVIYAAWNGKTRRHNPEPFYLDKKQAFSVATEIEDCRPKIEEVKK